MTCISCHNAYDLSEKNKDFCLREETRRDEKCRYGCSVIFVSTQILVSAGIASANVFPIALGKEG